MMAGYGYDAEASLLVVVRDSAGDDEEYAEFLRHVDALDAEAAARNRVPVFIVVTRPDTPAPNAHWRRRFAESAAASASSSMFAGIVTESAVQRGVINALRWLQDAPKGVSEAFSTFELAVAAAERHRRERLPQLESLRQQASADLARRGEGPRSSAKS